MVTSPEPIAPRFYETTESTGAKAANDGDAGAEVAGGEDVRARARGDGVAHANFGL
jgi:hypothetical protein